MATKAFHEPERSGFQFDYYDRNQQLMKQGVKPPKVMKTGTTTTAVIFKDGVVLGADTRATGGNVVMNKNCSKIHYLAKNMYCLGAGTAADTEYTTRLMAGKIKSFMFLNTHRTARFASPNHNTLVIIGYRRTEHSEIFRSARKS